MKIRMFLPAFIMMIVISACSDKDSNGSQEVNTGDTKSVYLQINMEKQKSRADVPTATGTAAPLYSALIYFMDDSADPVIFDVRTVGAGAAADATVAELQEGYQFMDVPNSVTQVYIVGNYNSSDAADNTADFPTGIGANLSDVEDVLLNIQQVAYPRLGGADYTGLLAVMTGQSDVVQYDTNPGGWGGDDPLDDEDLYADVSLVPVNSRLEIVNIVYDGTLIESFTLEGIYINNYYPEVPVNLDYTGATITNNGSDVTLYTPAAYAAYSTLFDELDEDVTPAGGTATITPDNGTWAYHVFGGSNPVPHIILRLDDVVSTAGTDLGTLYVTVRGYTNNDGGAEVTTFARNTIYKIASLTFTDEDLTVLPETETVNIWVHVEVTPWTTVNVTPII